MSCCEPLALRGARVRENVAHIIRACDGCPRAEINEHDIVHACRRIRNEAGAVCPAAYRWARLSVDGHCPEGKW